MPKTCYFWKAGRWHCRSLGRFSLQTRSDNLLPDPSDLLALGLPPLSGTLLKKKKNCLQKSSWLPAFPVGLSPLCIDLWWDSNGLNSTKCNICPWTHFRKVAGGVTGTNQQELYTHTRTQNHTTLRCHCPAGYILRLLVLKSSSGIPSWESLQNLTRVGAHPLLRRKQGSCPKIQAACPPAKVFAAYQPLHLPFQICASAKW